MVDETNEGNGEGDRREYRWNLMAAIVLSCATLASAWSGFQAAEWNGIYSSQSRASNTARLEAARQSDIADRQMSSDVLIFATWLEADLNGNEKLAGEITLRFPAHFTTAFESWRSGPIGQDGHLPDGTPFDEASYVLPTQAAADTANEQATQAVVAADTAAMYSSRYVLTTVLFASVLFLAGIAAKLTNLRLAHAVVVLAGITLAGAVVVLATLPIQLHGL